jgi:hypothetical protein
VNNAAAHLTRSSSSEGDEPWDAYVRLHVTEVADQEGGHVYGHGNSSSRVR